MDIDSDDDILIEKNNADVSPHPAMATRSAGQISIRQSAVKQAASAIGFGKVDGELIDESNARSCWAVGSAAILTGGGTERALRYATLRLPSTASGTAGRFSVLTHRTEQFQVTLQRLLVYL